jgi:hypothetical protein
VDTRGNNNSSGRGQGSGFASLSTVGGGTSSCQMMPSSSNSSQGVTSAADCEQNAPNALITALCNISVNSNSTALSTMTIISSGNVNKNSLSSLGDGSGVSIFLGNHAKFGLAERYW